MKKQVLYLLIFTFFSGFSFSQTSEKEEPYSFKNFKKQEIPFLELAKPDLTQIKLEDNKKLQFAKKIEITIPVKNKKNIYLKNDEFSIWRFGICAKDAISLNLTFSEFKIPKGSKLFVYSANKMSILGDFSSKNNTGSGIFPVLPIYSDSIIIEYFELNNSEFSSKLAIKSVGYGFIDLRENRSKSGSCNVDIRCELGLPWYLEKRGIAKMFIDNEFFCTGSLVNNTRNDETPYFLTANHCVSRESSANNTVFYFNYENLECGNASVGLFQTISGANLVATPEKDNQLDFSLLKLSEKVPDTFLPYYAGWDLSNSAVNKSVSIHHPDGDTKKISFANTALQTASYTGYIASTHWKINKWDIGTTESGSSGAPLFDENRRIVGILTGGTASCTALNESDYFAKFATAWSYYSEPNRQLKKWLNPDNENITTLNAFEPFPLTSENNAGIIEFISPQQVVCFGKNITAKVLIRNFSFTDLTTLKLKLKINDNLIDSIAWTGNLNSYETDFVEFKKFQMPEGNHKLTILISNPNNTTDAVMANDTLSCFFSVSEANYFKLKIETDNYGYETTWKIVNKAKETIFSGGPYASNSTFNYDICLEDSCATLIIYDAAADGVCCKYGNGLFEITNNSNSIIYESPPFTDSISFSFCSKIIEQDTTQNIFIYPNPMFENINVTYSNLSNLKYELYTLTGILLQVGIVSENNASITLNDFNSGAYIIRFFDNDLYEIFFKIIKINRK